MRKAATGIVVLLAMSLLVATPASAQDECTPKVTKAWATGTTVVGPTGEAPIRVRAETYDECAPLVEVWIGWRRQSIWIMPMEHLSGTVPTELWGHTTWVDTGDLDNADAGPHVISSGGMTDADGNEGGRQSDVGSLSMKRAASLTVNASPEPVARGRTITVTGRLLRANWDTEKWAAYASKLVKLQYRKSTATRYTTLKSVRTDSYGNLRTSVSATYDGYYRWFFPTNSTTAARVTAGDYVNVQ